MLIKQFSAYWGIKSGSYGPHILGKHLNCRKKGEKLWLFAHPDVCIGGTLLSSRPNIQSLSACLEVAL